MNTPEDKLHKFSAKAVLAFWELLKWMFYLSERGDKSRNHPGCVLYWMAGLNMNSSFVLVSSVEDLSTIEPSAKINFLFIWS